MDIGGWLRSLGLGQYESTFRENEIDADVLPDLTEIDLEKLGVPLGHRKRLLKAIASLGAAEKLAPALSPAPLDRDTDTAERRQVTVMFSDLVGSTALSTRMDPEDLREVISAYQKCIAETVRRFGGFVAKYMGDGVLVYFGYPQAHEDDAERAVRAGLELIAAVTGLKTRAALQTRVGVATGLVVVGDLVGSGEAQERGIVGETPNLAARLQGIAAPNVVVIAEGTRKLLGNLFELAGPWAKGPQGHRRAGAGLGGAAGEFCGKSLRGASRERPNRARRAAKKNSNCCFGAGRGPRPVKARSCSSPASPVSANRGSRRRCWNASLPSRTRACAISARRSTPIVRCTRSSAKWSVPPGSGTMTQRKRSWTNLMPCSRRALRRVRMPRYLRKCCRCRMTDATRHSNLLRSNGGKRRWRHSRRS